jgi:hypothetical protein
MNQITLKELTQRLQLTERRAQQLAKAGVFVKNGRGQYLLSESAVNFVSFLRRNAGSEAGIPVTLEEIARCIGETPGNARTLDKKGLFKRLSHGRYDLIESVRCYIQFQKTAWRGRGRPWKCSCGAPMLPLAIDEPVAGAGPIN